MASQLLNSKFLHVCSWFLVLLWMIVIFLFSAQNAKESSALSMGVTKSIVDTVDRIRTAKAESSKPVIKKEPKVKINVVPKATAPVKKAQKTSLKVTSNVVTEVPKPKPNYGKWNTLVRKQAHFFLFFVLGILVSTTMIINYKMSLTLKALVSFGICFIRALLDEFHQTFVPGRGAEWQDVMIDSFGALSAILLVFTSWLIVLKLIHRVRYVK